MEEGQNKQERNHPFKQANALSKLFFTWLFPLFYKGYRQDLNEEDLYPTLKQHDATLLGNKLAREWTRQLERDKKCPSLWRAIFAVFGWEILRLGLLQLFIELFARLAQPLILARLLTYYEPDTLMSRNEALLYSSLMVASPALVMFCQHNFMFYQFVMGVKIKVAATALVYRKALRLSRASLVATNIGQTVNLISNDVARFENAVKQSHSLWLGPLEMMVIIVLLYFYVGPTGMTGVFFLTLLIPVQMFLGKKTSKYRLSTASRTDERIRLMNEIVSGIQVIKMYTWEKPFAKLVEIVRWKEMQQIKNNFLIRAFVYSFQVFVPKMAIYFCVVAFVSTGNTLSSQFFYVVTAFYAILRPVLIKRLPEGVTHLAEAQISVKRIREFLMMEEIDYDSTKSKSIDEIEKRNDYCIKLEDLFVKWSSKLDDYALENITMEVSNKELAVIVGPVGSGKTTLLQTVLKELPALRGSIKVNGTISYASQEPWVFMGSIRQNIIFGQSFDFDRYQETIKVCALERDLALFPYGDKTIVGDRGVMLSGGQKARINLARAIYKSADIYLLDDPLSAVDPQVGKHIFDRCIRDYLKDKCVVLVTHQLQYLSEAQNIYLMDSGRIQFNGSFEKMEKSGHEYAKLLVKLSNNNTSNDNGSVENKIDSKIDKKVDEQVKTLSPKVNKENKAVGNIAKSVYKTYFLNGGNWCSVLWTFGLFFVTQALASLLDYYISWWVNAEALRKTRTDLLNSSDTILPNPKASLIQELWLAYMTTDTALIIYTILIIALISFALSRSILFFRFAVRASVKLHNGMFDKIVYATMRFFHLNPSGRILNRFSHDMNQVDEALPATMLDCFQNALAVLGTTVVVAVVNPWMLVPTVVILGVFYWMRVVYICTSRDVKRVESITRSPVYSHLTATFQGLSTIRAFGAQTVLRQEFERHQNRNSAPAILFIALGRSFGFWLDFGCVIYICLVTMSFLFVKTDTLGGFVGLSITQSMTLTGMFQMCIRQWSELENQMTCVERIKEYVDVLPEPDGNGNVPEDWPNKGHITFKALNMRYDKDEPLVLKNVNFRIRSKEKVGIVGRTGAGKSSIIIALFRLALNEGLISIDNIDSENVNLQKLRSSISIIPQEPVLFTGTLRKNLDPFDQYDDEVLWYALEQVDLKETISELPHGLQSEMSENGSNFSVGQRQLICLARAIIRNNKILVMDEATANVDPRTDALIQKTIRKKFSDCTVLTVAHRLHTIMDSDKVLVMDAGTVVEFGRPRDLLDQNGKFAEMVKQTGKGVEENLRSIAEKAYEMLLPRTEK